MHRVSLARWTYAGRMQSAHSGHMLNNPTNEQGVANALNEWSAHAVLDLSCKHAGCALGVRHVCARCALGQALGVR